MCIHIYARVSLVSVIVRMYVWNVTYKMFVMILWKLVRDILYYTRNITKYLYTDTNTRAHTHSYVYKIGAPYSISTYICSNTQYWLKSVAPPSAYSDFFYSLFTVFRSGVIVVIFVVAIVVPKVHKIYCLCVCSRAKRKARKGRMTEKSKSIIVTWIAFGVKSWRKTHIYIYFKWRYKLSRTHNIHYSQNIFSKRYIHTSVFCVCGSSFLHLFILSWMSWTCLLPQILLFFS